MVATPSTFVEALRSLPLRFDSERAGREFARVHVSTVGPEPGNWTVTVRNGSCSVEEGSVAGSSLRVHVPSDVGLQIMRGEMDAAWAYSNGLFVVDGEVDTLRKLGAWFSWRATER